MSNPLTGIVRGNVISLDEAVPEVDGRRVRLLLEPMEQAETVLSTGEQERHWRHWAEAGPDGPIDDEDGSEFP